MGRIAKIIELSVVTVLAGVLVGPAQLKVAAATEISVAEQTKLGSDAAKLSASSTSDMSLANSAVTTSKSSETTAPTKSTASSIRPNRQALTKAATATSGVLGTVTWKLNGSELDLSGGNFGTSLAAYDMASPWESIATSIKKIVIEGPIVADAGASYRYLFHELTNLASIENLDKMDFSNVVDTTAMFYMDGRLTTLDLGQADFSHLKLMNSMFYGCYSLENLDVSRWNLSQVTQMGTLFMTCNKLKTLDVSNWNVSHVEMFSSMFSGTALTSLDLSGWQMLADAKTASMFTYTRTLSHLKLGKQTKISGTSLPEPTAPATKWVRAGTTETYTSADLMAKYAGSTMAGDYYWDTTPLVVVNYVDEDGHQLADPQLKAGTVGETYTITAPTVSGYTLQNRPTNATGTYTTGTTTVTYVYTGDLFFKSVPTSIDFGQHTITAGTATYPVTKHTGDLTIQNNGKLQSYWQLSAQLAATGFVGNDKGATLAATLSYQSSNGQLVTLQPGAPAIIETQQTASHEPINLSDSWTNAETGLQLKVPAGAARQDNYQATLTWTLAKTVANN